MIETKDITRPPRDLVDRLKAIGSATITGTLNRMGIRDVHMGGPVAWNKGKVAAGPALTLKFLPKREDIYGDGEAFYYFVFPNIMLNILPSRLQSNRIVPLGPGRCHVEFDYFYSPTPEALARVERDQVVTDGVQAEDMGICEWVQKGLASGQYEPGRLSPRREGGVWHFHELLRAVYADVGA